MADTISPSDSPADVSRFKWNGPVPRRDGSGRTERLVHETWRHYYVARLAEAQFGPDSLEASIARSRAFESYRELRGSLRALDPYYGRSPGGNGCAPSPVVRHLTLVRDEPVGHDTQCDL